MSAPHPVVTPIEEVGQPCKRLKRSADDLAISSLVRYNDEPPQAMQPGYVYLVTITTTHYDQEDSHVAGAYLTKDDAAKAAWNLIIEESSPDAEIEDQSSTDGLPYLECNDIDFDGSLFVYVREVKLWPAGSVNRGPLALPSGRNAQVTTGRLATEGLGQDGHGHDEEEKADDDDDLDSECGKYDDVY